MRAVVARMRALDVLAVSPYLALVWVGAILVRSYFWAAFPAPLSLVDESYVAAFAIRMLNGHWLPYVDAVSHRGPVFYLAAALAFRVFGIGVRTLRGLSLFLSLATVGGMFVAAKAAKRPFVGAVAVLGWGVACLGHYSPLDSLAYDGEAMVAAFDMAALASLVTGLGDRRVRRRSWLFAAGLFVALGALSKQTGVVACFPLLAWLGAAAASRQEHGRADRIEWVLAFVSGAALPVLLLVTRYAAAHELHALYYYTVTYNRDVYALTGAARMAAWRVWMLQHLVFLSAVFALATAVVARLARGSFLRAWDEEGFTVTVLVGTLVVYLVVNASLRNFDHYYKPLLPWAALLAGHLLDAGAKPFERRLPAVLTLCVLGAAAAWGWAIERTEFDQSPLPGMLRFPGMTPAVCSYFDSYTSKWDPVFVWGFWPEPYLGCQRTPASRFVFTTFPSGVVPWLDGTLAEENARAVPGSRTLLIQDLESSQPRVIVDASWSLLGRSMTRYRELASYLKAKYCRDDGMPGTPTYLRKAPGARCYQPSKKPASTSPPPLPPRG